MRDYSVFGLRVRSELNLPELFPPEGEGAADVTIRLGSIADPQHEEGLHAVDGALIFVAAQAGRFRIANGSEIVIEPKPGAPDRNVRLYLLGSAFGALLHQRGLLPLHANAVEIEGRAIAFMAPSGEGKSTLAAWFHDHGHRVIADDVCVVRFEGERPVMAAGLPRLRLWKDALVASGRRQSEFQRSFVGDEDYEKFDVPMSSQRPNGSDVQLGAIYILERGNELSIAQLGGIEAIEAIFANTYRGGFVGKADSAERHWEACVQLVAGVPIFRLARPWGRDVFAETTAQMLEHVHAVLQAS